MADLNPLKFQVAIQDQATEQLKQIEKEFLKLNDKTINVTINGIDDLRSLLTLLQHRQVQNIGKEVANGINDATKSLQNEAQKAIRESLGKLAEDLTLVKLAIQHDNFTAFSTRISKCAEAVETLDAAFKKFHVTIGQDEGMKNFMTGLGEVIRNVRSTMNNLESTRSGGMSRQGEIYVRNVQRMEDALYRLQMARAKVGNAIKEGEMLGMPNVANMRIFMQFLDAYEKKLRNIRSNSEMMNSNGWQPAAFGAVFKHMLANAGDFQKQVDAFRKSTDAKSANANATRQLTDQERQLAMALRGSTHEAKGQSQILSDLKSLASQYLGVWGGQQFLNNIIKIGGQLESQRLSLTAILGQRSYANDLFAKIQDLALKSPFGVVQLDQYSKNLSAFGFQYNELFDMTKRLADIAAGTGTDFGRLALALGHVRSEMALTGYTLRQFSMANVPMLKMLAENIGVTTSEIRKMVREKKVSYEDVEKVLKDLTDEGGMFYNMQEVMSDAVSAKFKNLKDAMDIMYGQMAESVIGDMLKGIAATLTEVTKRWQTFGSIIASTAVLIGTYKLYMHLLNVGIKTNTVNILQNAAAAQTLKAADVQLMMEKKLLTAQDIALALAERRLTMEQAKAALMSAGYTEAIVNQIAATRGLTGAMAGLKASTAGMVGMLTNPWTAALIAVEAVIGAVMAYKTWSDDIDNDVNRVLEHYKTSSQEIGKYLRGSEKEGKPTDERDLSAEIEQIKTILQNSELYTEELQEQISLAPSLSAEYDVLIGKMKEANANLEKMGVNADAISQAIKHSSGDFNSTSYTENLRWFFNEDINKNSEQLEKSYSQYQRIISTLDEYQAKMKSAVGVMIDVYHHGELANLPFEEQIRLLAQDKDAWKTFVAIVDGGSGKFVDVAEKLKDAANDVSDDWSEIVNDDVPRMMNKMAELFGKTPDQFREWAKTHNTIFQNMLDTMVSAVKIASPKIATALRNAILGWLNGDSNTNFEQPVETPQQRFDRERREIQAKRNAIIKGYGEIGKHAMTTLTDYANSNGKKGLFDINFVGDYFKAEGSTSDGLDAIAKDYKKYKGLIAAAKKAGNSAEEKIYESRFNQLDAAMDAFGLDKTKGDKKQKQGEKDKEAKELRERVRILKEAADSYQYWRDKVGDSGAEGHVNDEFGKLLSEQGFKFENALKFREALQELRKEYEKKPQSKAMLEALKELDRELAQLDRKDFEKHSEDFLSSMKSELDILTRAWETYKNVRETTGDKSLAEELSGINGLSAYTALADAVRAKLERKMSSLGAGGGLSFGSNLSDKELEKEVFAAVPKSTEESVEQYEERIKGLVEVYKKWRDLQRDAIKADLSSYTKLLSLCSSYDAQIKRINDKLESQKESNKNLVANGVISQSDADKANDIATAQADWEKMQLSAQYQNLYTNAVAMSKEEFEAATKAVEKMIARLKELGLLSPDQAIQENDKLEKARTEWGTTGFLGEKGAVGQFISGGYDGLTNYYAKRRDAAQQRAERAEKGSKEQKDAQKEAEHYGELFQKMSQLSDTVKDTVTALNLLKSGLDIVTNLFDSMGAEGAANATGDAADLLGGAMQGASSLSALGPYGMAAGAGLGLVSGLFQLHDKAIQREIDALQDNVDALQENTESIKAARARTFGYDTGNIRREMADDYANYKELNDFLSMWRGRDVYTDNDAMKAMYEYYSKNSSGSGYAAELANLKEQREDYIKMYNLENDKKNTSDDTLNEYKQKIAELDEQIRYFTEDLAKELWDIDIKGWADQISDSLCTAFENGESAAKAYQDTVTNILQSVMNKMMQMAILEPMFQNLQDLLFGNSNKNIKGVFDSNNPKGSMAAVISTIGNFFGKGGEGEEAITAALEFMNAFERGLNNSGLSVLNSDNANTLSSSIHGTSEETSDLLAGYVNAARQDLSASRILLMQFVAELWPTYIEQVATAIRSLNNIDQNVAFIRTLLSENGALYMMLDSMKSHLDQITNGNEQVSVK